MAEGAESTKGSGAAQYSESDLRAALMPILRRLPAYARLGWVLAREPAIPARHKSILASALVWYVLPIHYAVNAIPIVGQVDNITLYLLGVRQALNNCPPEIAQAHLDRLGLGPAQLDEDLTTILDVARRAFGKLSSRVSRELKFAGRIADGFGRRVALRIVQDEEIPDAGEELVQTGRVVSVWVGDRLRFAGKVAGAFSYRLARRIAEDEPEEFSGSNPENDSAEPAQKPVKALPPVSSPQRRKSTGSRSRPERTAA